MQSYAKNMGLYAERTGVLAMVCSDAAVAERVREQLGRTIRLTYSSPPQHGAAIVATILSDPERAAAWRAEVQAMAGRLLEMRAALYGALSRVKCPVRRSSSHAPSAPSRARRCAGRTSWRRGRSSRR